jgi:hypothetical protein
VSFVTFRVLAQDSNGSSNMAEFLGDPRFPDKAMRLRSHPLQIEYFQGLYKQYSRRTFAHDYDRPFAIAGIERRLLKAFDTRGRYGIFGDDEKVKSELFHRSLLWQRNPDDDMLYAIDFPAELNVTVPSWSWMAYKGGIDYCDPPYGSAFWERHEIGWPWAHLTVDLDTSDKDISLTAWARDFSLAGRLRDEVEVAYDTEKRTEGKKVQCVIIARSIAGIDSEKRFYVLLVIPTGAETVEGVKKYKRVGAGTMLGKYIVLDKVPVQIKIF